MKWIFEISMFFRLTKFELRETPASCGFDHNCTGLFILGDSELRDEPKSTGLEQARDRSYLGAGRREVHGLVGHKVDVPPAYV